MEASNTQNIGNTPEKPGMSPLEKKKLGISAFGALSSMIPSSISGNSTGMGSDIANGVGSALISSGNPYAMAAGAAIKIGNLAVNELFGSNVNKELVDSLKNQTSELQLGISSSKSVDTLASNANKLSDLFSYASNADWGTQGAFNNDVTNARETFFKRFAANTNNVGTTAANIQGQNIDNIQRNQAVQMAEGGGIHINPANKGKFTASAKRAGMGVQEFARHVLANKEDYSSTQVKRANFARNASKWEHPDGGFLTNPFSNGVTEVNTGGTHEENPNEGVPMGIAPDGKPNLVEEGEVIYKDYVYSNRIPIPKEIRSKYKLRDSIKTYAEAFKELEKESKERPNDPISQNGLDAMAIDLASSQEMKRDKKNKEINGNKYFEGSKLRYMEPIGSAMALAYNLFDPWKPPTLDEVRAPQQIEAPQLNDYLDRTIFDRNYWTNQLAAEQAASRRGLSSDAARLAADFNSGMKLGALARQGEEFNLNDKYKTAEFNRGTNQYNAQSKLSALQANATLLSDYNKALLSQAQANAQLKMAHKQSKDTAFGQNLGNIFSSLGGIGKEEAIKNIILALADKGALSATLKDVADIYKSTR